MQPRAVGRFWGYFGAIQLVLFNPKQPTTTKYHHALREARIVKPDQRPATGGGDAFETAIQERIDAIKSPNYRRTSRTVLDRWATFCRQEGAAELDDVDANLCREYAKHLRQQVREGEIAPNTAHNYYAIVRAAFSWWVRDGAVPENPAKNNDAVDELPEDTGDTDQQFWTRGQRTTLLLHADERVDEALDTDDQDRRLQAYRDRALAYLLALTGVRSAEVLRDPGDDDRRGLCWDDVGAGMIEVFGKAREHEFAPVPDRVAERLDRWRDILEPAPDEWPVLPVLDKGTLTRDLRAKELGTGIDPTDTVADRLAVYRKQGVCPPALSTTAGRKVMKRLTDAAGLDVDEGYLKPHGARRGLGSELYEEDVTLAQETLRHKSPETTHRKYRDVQAAERAKEIDDVLE